MAVTSLKINRLLVLGLLLVLMGHHAGAQEWNPDYNGAPYLNNNYSFVNMTLKDSGEVHSPKKATIMSAVIPGLGQAYNQKYWKIGIIYAGFIGLGYGYKYNNDSMKRYQQALDYRIDGDTNTIDPFYPLLSDNKIKQERNYYRTNRDRIIIGIVALYALQIIDANVDAHLKEFEINKELSLRIRPQMGFVPMAGFRPSLCMTLSF